MSGTYLPSNELIRALCFCHYSISVTYADYKVLIQIWWSWNGAYPYVRTSYIPVVDLGAYFNTYISVTTSRSLTKNPRSSLHIYVGTWLYIIFLKISWSVSRSIFLSVFCFLLFLFIFPHLPSSLLRYSFPFLFVLFQLVLFSVESSSHQQLSSGHPSVSEDIYKTAKVQPPNLPNSFRDEVYARVD